MALRDSGLRWPSAWSWLWPSSQGWPCSRVCKRPSRRRSSSTRLSGARSPFSEELDVDDLARVVEVAASSCRTDEGLVLLSVSYGGALALVAAADERVAGCIDLVATFGAYADLVGVLQAAVTGVSVVDGQVVCLPPRTSSTA